MTKEAKIYNGVKTVFSINVFGKTGQIHVKKWNDYFLIPYRINSKWINDLNVGLEARKLSKENTGSKLLDITLSNKFLDMSPQTRKTKEKNKQMGLHQTKEFCTVKETINKTKRPTD